MPLDMLGRGINDHICAEFKAILQGGLPVAALQHYRELLATVARTQVGLAAAALQHPGHLEQCTIAGGVSVAIVDALEAIDVAHHDRHRRAVQTTGAVGLLEPRLQHAPVGQASEVVALRLAPWLTP